IPHLSSLSLHDALPICVSVNVDTGLIIEKYNTGAYPMPVKNKKAYSGQFYKFIIASTASGEAKEYSVDDIYHYGQSSDDSFHVRSEEHTSELQSRFDLV